MVWFKATRTIKCYVECVNRLCHMCGKRTRIVGVTVYSSGHQIAYVGLCRGCLERLLEWFPRGD